MDFIVSGFLFTFSQALWKFEEGEVNKATNYRQCEHSYHHKKINIELHKHLQHPTQQNITKTMVEENSMFSF
jgi:hypothetical protein